MTRPLVYVLEDEPDIARLIVRTLREHGMDTGAFSRQGDLRRELKRRRPDICLIDLTLPDGDGLDTLREHLSKTDIPVIVVSARDAASDRVIGLELGADDYVSKPFEPRELVARVRAVLRRVSGKSDVRGSGRVAEFEGWRVDFQACEITDPAGRVQPLSSAEARLLETFLRASGRVLSRAQLFNLDAPGDIEPEDRSMDARISRLRRRLRDDPKSPRLIRTVYGAGYIFTIKPKWL
ncbi:response regulator transcription factor [Hoeflea sp. TYP-13]|uniref:response regulator transcription factor n=1 Tax=Hoeflea sp. TYP-13 TaxID=3230023 RepID=UPI0034C68678